jgi:hypothetical protein
MVITIIAFFHDTLNASMKHVIHFDASPSVNEDVELLRIPRCIYLCVVAFEPARGISLTLLRMVEPKSRVP